MKAAEIRALSDEALVHKELELERALVAHQFRHRLNKLENTSVLEKTRRDIARAQTIRGERERLADAPAGSLKSKHQGSFKPVAVATGAEAGGGFLGGLLDKQEGQE
jgi:large subunit ribosomal protein L29